MLKAFRVSLLVLTLSGSVYAGDIPNGVQPPPPGPTSVVEEPSDIIVIQEPQQDIVTAAEISLDLVQLVLGLF